MEKKREGLVAAMRAKREWLKGKSIKEIMQVLGETLFPPLVIDEELRKSLERSKEYKKHMIEKRDALYNLPDQDEEYVKMIEERLANQGFEDSRHLVTEYELHSGYYEKMIEYGFPLTLEGFKQFTHAKRESRKNGKSGEIERIS